MSHVFPNLSVYQIYCLDSDLMIYLVIANKFGQLIIFISNVITIHFLTNDVMDMSTFIKLFILLTLILTIKIH